MSSFSVIRRGVTPVLEARVIEATALVVQKQTGDAFIEMQKALLELNQLRGRRADAPLVVQRAEFSFPSYPAIPSAPGTNGQATTTVWKARIKGARSPRPEGSL